METSKQLPGYGHASMKQVKAEPIDLDPELPASAAAEGLEAIPLSVVMPKTRVKKPFMLVKRGTKCHLKSRFSSRRMHAFASSLNEVQRGFVAKHGLESLLRVQPLNLPGPLLEWIMSRIDPVMCEFRHKNKKICFDSRLVQKILGIPSGQRPVVQYGNSDDIAEIRESYKKGKRAPIPFALEKAKNSNVEEEFMRSYMLVAIASILCPSSQNNVDLDYIYSLRDIAALSEYDWAGHVLSVLMSEVSKFHKMNSKARLKDYYVGGCLHILAIAYVDHLEIHVSPINKIALNYSTPRLCHFSDADYELAMKVDRSKLCLNRVVFGHRPFRSPSSTPYFNGQLGDNAGASQSTSFEEWVQLSQSSKGCEIPKIIQDLFENHRKIWAKDMKNVIANINYLYNSRVGALLSEVCQVLSQSVVHQESGISLQTAPLTSTDTEQRIDEAEEEVVRRTDEAAQVGSPKAHKESIPVVVSPASPAERHVANQKSPSDSPNPDGFVVKCSMGTGTNQGEPSCVGSPEHANIGATCSSPTRSDDPAVVDCKTSSPRSPSTPTSPARSDAAAAVDGKTSSPRSPIRNETKWPIYCRDSEIPSFSLGQKFVESPEDNTVGQISSKVFSCKAIEVYVQRPSRDPDANEPVNIDCKVAQEASGPSTCEKKNIKKRTTKHIDDDAKIKKLKVDKFFEMETSTQLPGYGHASMKPVKAEPIDLDLELPASAAAEGPETTPLSGNPFFSVVMSKTQVQKPFMMFIPARFHHRLPKARAAAVLLCRGRSWTVGYCGEQKQKRFDASWMDFAVDNRLRVGDACVFDLISGEGATTATFQVQILRGGLPEQVVTSKGATAGEPIVIVD